MELYKEFAEEAYSIALHPSGLYILVGFSDKLRLMNLLIDDIRTFKELPIRGCREVRHVTDTWLEVENKDMVQITACVLIPGLCHCSYRQRAMPFRQALVDCSRALLQADWMPDVGV